MDSTSPKLTDGHVPMVRPLGGTTTIAPGSDLEALGVDDTLDFVPVRVTHTSDVSTSVVKTWEQLGGVLLALHFCGEGFHRIEGSAVVVAPGVALSASHVLRDYMDRYRAGTIQVLCVGPAEHGRMLWNLNGVRFIPNTDICILSLSLLDGLAPDRRIRQASVTTRTPKRGERLTFFGFNALEEDCDLRTEGKKIRTGAIVCSGRVTQHFLPMRDKVLLPGPAIEVDCETWRGMSGGPVFDEQGWLVGVLSTGIDGGPSNVSLAMSALAAPILGGWPDPGTGVARSLLTMASKGGGCLVERPESIVASYPDGGRFTEYVYTTWQTRQAPDGSPGSAGVESS